MFKQIPAYPKYEMDIYGKVRNIKTKHLLKPRLIKGYEGVCLMKNGIKHWLLVHRLLCHTYLDFDLKSKLQVDHIDGVRHNNYLKNLEVVSPKENCIRAHIRLGKRIYIPMSEYKSLWQKTIGNERQNHKRALKNIPILLGEINE